MKRVGQWWKRVRPARRPSLSLRRPATEVVPGERTPENAGDATLDARLRLLLALMLTVLAIFLGRLLYLQFAMADTYSERSARNIWQQQAISPLRGRILARDGTVLADNRVAYDLMYLGGSVQGWPGLANLLGIEGDPRPPDRSRAEERQAGATVAWNIPDHLIPAVEERIAGQPNLYLRERIERIYPTNLAAQLIGYTSQANPERNSGYAVDDLAGVSGIEATWELALYGAPGLRRVLVDNRGAVIGTEVVEPAQPGQDVVLTIDPVLQRLAEDVLARGLDYVNADRVRNGRPLDTYVRGALVVVNTRSGEILASASAPTFDQNLFAKRPIDPVLVNEVLQDTRALPLQNRAVEAFPPASTFKMVTSLALLNGGWISPSTRYTCTATFTLGGITFRNWHEVSMGSYDLRNAIADSCNTYYWNAVVNTTGAARGWAPFISQTVALARALGFDEPVGVGVREEKAGRIPDEDWVRAQPQYQHGWLPGFTLNTVIGQGDVLATPMQVLQLIQLLAMGGEVIQPHLVARVGDEPFAVSVRSVEASGWRVMQEGMRMVFTDYPSRNIMGSPAFPVAMAGKTGTGQTSRGEDYNDVWFMGYGPYADPEIALVVYVQNGNSSTQVAVPMARDFFAGYWGIPLPASSAIARTP